MYALLRRVTPAFFEIAGILWLTVNLRTVTDALPTTLLLLAPISLAIAISGLHLHYRMYRTAFYEEIGFVLVLLGSFLTMVAISIQPPTGTETILVSTKRYRNPLSSPPK
jgi:hypothetical protein